MTTRYTVCSADGCPSLSTRGGRCDDCRRAADQARGTRQARGYTADHDRLRARWLPLVMRGEADCWRCGQSIEAAEEWHLGHDDEDRSVHRGPEHKLCNLSAAGRAAHRYR